MTKEYLKQLMELIRLDDTKWSFEDPYEAIAQVRMTANWAIQSKALTEPEAKELIRFGQSQSLCLRSSYCGGF